MGPMFMRKKNQLTEKSIQNIHKLQNIYYQKLNKEKLGKVIC